MPMALLLTEVMTKIGKLLEKLEPWNQLVSLEVLLVGRARSAFLVHWFGPGIPLDGFHVRIAIANMEALERRYRAVMDETHRPQVQNTPDLVAPIAGMAGQLVGGLLSPITFVAAVGHAERLIRKWWFSIIVCLNTLTMGVLSPLLIGGGLVLLGFAFVPGTARIQEFLGAVAALAIPLAEFWDQIAAENRDAIRNPLVRAVMDVLDRLAVLMPFIFATIAIFLPRIARMIDPMWRQFVALGALIDAVFDAAGFIINNTIELFTRWLDPDDPGSLFGAFNRILRIFIRLWTSVSNELDAAFHMVAGAFLEIFDGLRIYFSEVASYIVTNFLLMVTRFPLTPVFFGIAGRIGHVRRIWARTAPPEEPTDWGAFEPVIDAFADLFRPIGERFTGLPESILPDLEPPDIDAIISSRTPTPRQFGEIATLAESLRAGGGDPFENITANLRRPRSVFAGEQAALDRMARETYGAPTAAAAAAQLHLDEERLRTMLVGIVDRVLPERARTEVHNLLPILEEVDRALFRDRTPTETAFPVLTPDASHTLQPRVRRLIVRVAGGARTAAEEWTEGLRVRLTGQVYPMPAE